MKNERYERFSKEKFNLNKNYEAIMTKVKEGKAMKKNKNTQYKKILNIAAVILVVVLVGSIAPRIYAKIQWDIKFKEYQNREFETGQGTIKEAMASGYNEEIDMDYVTQDGIRVKVDSLMITDDYLEANINFEFEDDIKVNSETFGFGYAIYDDQKNIYGVFTRMHLGSNEKRDYYTPYMYQEIGVEYNKNDIYAIQLNDTAGTENISAIDRNIISKIKMGSTKGFPKSKKLYIRVFDLGYHMVDVHTDGTPNIMENFTISDAEWIFEIDVPDKFYERQTTELKLKDEIPGVEIEKITVTEVGLIIKAKIEGYGVQLENNGIQEWQKLRNETINITDEEGNIYYENTIGMVQLGKDTVRMNFEINKNMLSKKLFLNVKVNGQQYSSELIEK